MKTTLTSWIIFSIILIASGCSNPSAQTSPLREKMTSNVTKVINRVECIRFSCGEQKTKNLWQRCLEIGYQTAIPSEKIVYSRDIKEIVHASEVIKRLETSIVEQTSPIGVVTNTTSQPVEKTDVVEYTGYCIGSEYIWESI